MHKIVKNNNPIDFVITWVNGDDSNWLKKRRKYSKSDLNLDEIRFRDWGTLKYLFRGIEKYADFVNNVFLITDSQIPDWINLNHPKLKIIFHENYIPTEYLPTFNSNTIEINIHRLKELSDNFVLFNDDMFIINHVKEEDFFVNDLPCDSAIMNPIVTYDNDSFSKVVLNNMLIINKFFDKTSTIKRAKSNWFNLKYGKYLIRNFLLLPWKHFLGFYDFHIPYSINKHTIEKIWELEEETMSNTSKTRFRNNNDNINQWLFRYYQLASNSFIPRNTNFGTIFQYPLTSKQLHRILFENKNKVICLNDGKNAFEFEIEKKKTLDIFEIKFPDKSSYEK